jgi:hypothetical protein
LFERFERRCAQHAVFPGCFFEDCGEELSLFRLVLIAETVAGVARHAGEIEGGREW